MKRKKIWFVLVFAMVALVGLYLYERYYLSQPVIYPDFGIMIPAGYNTHGIDVSRYQRKINWEEVVNMRDQGQRISFVIVKATEGVSYTDANFEKNWKGIKESNLLRGAYLYYHPKSDPARQAEFYIKTAQLTEGDLPPIVDIEETNRMSPENIRKSLQECLDVLEKKYKRKPIIYTGADFYEQKLGAQFDDYPLWVAHYEQPVAPRIGRDWIMWQHNCRGNVNGIRGKVDFNVANGSIAVLRNLCL